MLKAVVRNADHTIGVGLAESMIVKPGPGPTKPELLDLQITGGGAALKAENTMSGRIEVRVDPRGHPGGAPLHTVMAHELLGHGWDLMFKGKSSEHSATNTENLIRLSLGLPIRPNQIVGPWPDDPER